MCIDEWVKELTQCDATLCASSLSAPGPKLTAAVHEGTESLDDDRDTSPLDVPSLSVTYTHKCDPFTRPRTQQHGFLSPIPWLEPVKYEGERSRHLSLRRQPSNESDLPRSRAASFSEGKSESGYSSSDLGHSARSCSVSSEQMPEWESSQPASPTDNARAFHVRVHN